MNLNRKSRFVSFILTLLLGPLGLMYSSFVAGAVLIIIAIATAPTLIGPVVCWVLSVLIGDSATYKHNRNIEKFEDLMRMNRNAHL